MASSSELVRNVDSQAHPTDWKNRVLPAAFAAAFGLMVLYVTGFAETEALHNAAHDARHSAAIPCH